MCKSARSVLFRLFLWCALVVPVSAWANDHGGGGGGSDLVNMETITTNLAPEPGGNVRFIQLTIALRLHDPSGAAAISAYMPQIRNDILGLLASRTGAELLITKAREDLSDDIQDAVNAVVGTAAYTDKKGHAHRAEGPVKRALFTTFIVQ
ncbi:MAG TPA: flagellar basal body-associated FliL family protein [Rhodocyclaceae bacterium]|uniref:flagellar basal body-associated FliL family protein n=1 Tax=Zoogloea sp. TaxID=49181 RepID=UPI002C5EAD7D|nr:flagellar basal body-associated FliL family protein [Zoogloea sp.]HMV17861.1 flagellar basal body-associated FliL family protein [Rhodocyclaceae bacterium]HMV62205.1 flagellar basal body-associated FliL family protein [Rhodocyclaceae bacterium]HMW51825.1 flagellar basal body-associated FliL family protein [Rhodocyclaceae bacterium]HNA67182.1 flagellar basal body-associated FliL family protein [Rhodocyclaceae bacterium]HNB65902.1 flagellar basal body-associated FliL family protein [Rhodocycl